MAECVSGVEIEGGGVDDRTSWKFTCFRNVGGETELVPVAF